MSSFQFKGDSQLIVNSDLLILKTRRRIYSTRLGLKKYVIQHCFISYFVVFK